MKFEIFLQGVIQEILLEGVEPQKEAPSGHHEKPDQSSP